MEKQTENATTSQEQPSSAKPQEPKIPPNTPPKDVLKPPQQNNSVKTIDATKQAPPEKDSSKPPGKPAPAAAKKQPEKDAKPPKLDKPDTQKTDKNKACGNIGNKSSKKDNATKVPAPPGKSNPAEPEQPLVPRDAPRNGEPEQIVYLNLSELHNFKNHPFAVRDDAEMKSLVESVRDGGVNQPALVRPREGGGYELVAGHRRKYASEFAGYKNMPCIVRDMTDDEAVLAMTDDNLRQRSEILPSEKAISLKMQVDAIKHQGVRFKGVASGDIGKRSIDIVGERNGMNAKQVQRYIRLTELVPDLSKLMDEKKLGFTPAVEISFIKRKNQNLIAISLEGQQSSPSLSQAQHMKELDQKGLLNGDVIDGILCEPKKEEIKVIISGKELETYFGKDKTPREMKDRIIKLLDDWAAKEKMHNPPEKQTGRDK